MTGSGDEAVVTVDMLLADLAVLEDECEGDFAWILERLLLENHVLRRNQPQGFLKGSLNIPGGVTRFLALKKEDAATDTAE